jgi:glycosyltransferase involved in cell wall biosynthesis
VPLKLLIITDTFRNNCARGSDVFCTALIESLRRRHAVTVITSGDSSSPGVAASEGVIRLGPSSIADPDELQRVLLEQLATEEFDLIYNLGGMIFGNTVVSIFLEANSRLPLANHFQTMLGSYAGEEGYGKATVDFNQEGQKESAEHAVLNIFLSQSEYRDALLAGFDISRGLASVIPAGVRSVDVHAVDPQDWLPARPKDVGRPTVFLTAGRFSDYIKGGDLIYRAFVHLYKRNSNVFLLVVSNSRRFADLLQELPQNAYRIIDWLPRSRFLATIAGADVIVVPSRYESFGLTAVEAMMLQKPVIANNVGGLQEIVYHGETGILTDVREGSFGLYRALKQLADNPSLRRAMGEAASRHARREFDLDRVTDLVEKSLAAAVVRHRSLASSAAFAC